MGSKASADSGSHVLFCGPSRLFLVFCSGSSKPMLETTAEVACPHCGETITLLFDLSVESQTYIEDCSVCCQPMSVSYTVQDGELAGITVESAS
jgi:Cysteine-rich CPXCG